MRPVSVSTALFDGYPLETALRLIAEAGATHVEPAFIKGYVDFDETSFAPASAARLERLIREAGLGMIAVSAHCDLGADDANAMLHRRIDFAGQLGAPFLVTNAGKTDRRDRVLRVLHDAAGPCERAGVVLALENPGHGTSEMLRNGRDGAALVAALGAPHVRLNYDAGNVLTYSDKALGPETDIADAIPSVVHLHLKDVAERGGDWVFTALGQGEVDFPTLWAKVPPELPVAIELPLRLSRPGRADPVRFPEPLPIPVLEDALRKSLAFVRSLDR